jgi:hypothetical protein
MATCAYCQSTVLFGGMKVGRLEFCNPECAAKGRALVLADAMPDDQVRDMVQSLHDGNCPLCKGPGPVDVHTSCTVRSFIVMSISKTHRVLCCRRCGLKSQAKAALFSLVAGPWSPHGLFITPIQIIKNVLFALTPLSPAQPSEEMIAMVKTQVASKYVDVKEGGTTCPHCGAHYNVNDYRPDLEHIFCSQCKGELPRQARPPSPGANPERAVN